MSLHIEPSPEVEAQIARQKRNSTIISILISIVGFILLSFLLAFIALKGTFRDISKVVAYSAPQVKEVETPTVPEVQHKIQNKPTAPASSSALAKVIAASTQSSISLPVPDIEINPISTDFGNSNDFGDTGWGSGNNGSGQNVSTLFGSSSETGLKGTFYDLKQDKEYKISDLGKIYQSTSNFGSRIKAYSEELKKLQISRFSSTRMKQYFASNRPLYFTHLVMPRSEAESAPTAFQVENQVKASGWLIIYEGVVSKGSPKFKFHGGFDDVLIVYLNGKIVFDGSYDSVYSDKFNSSKNAGFDIMRGFKNRSSDYLRFKAGDRVRILVGEVPGGIVGGGLFVELKGSQYPDGFPPFTTRSLTSGDKKRINDLKNVHIDTRSTPIFSFE